jgi:hypothetical protein
MLVLMGSIFVNNNPLILLKKLKKPTREMISTETPSPTDCYST